MKEESKSEGRTSIEDKSDNYINIKDESKIRKNIYLTIKKCRLSAILLFLCSIILFLITLSLNGKIEVLSNLKFLLSGYFYQLINLFSVMIVTIIGRKKVFISIKDIIKKKQEIRSLPLLAFIGSILQAIFIFFRKDDFLNGNVPIYSFIYSFSMLMIYSSEYLSISKIKKDFKFLTSRTDKVNIQIETSKKKLEELFKFNTNKKLSLVYESSKYYKNNLDKILNNKSSDIKIFDKISYINWIACILGFIWGILVDRSIYTAVQNLSFTSCICIPLCNYFVRDMILKKASSSLLSKGCVVNGEKGINQFYKANCILVKSSQLYPPDKVSVKGIRTFGEQRIDAALLYAAAIENSLDSTLNKVFEKALSYKVNRYPKTSSVHYENDLGVVGWADGKRILIGNRELLKKYKVCPPSQVFEHKCCAKNQKAVYISVKGELVAMLVISYKSDKSIRRDIKGLVNHGIKLFVNTNDVSITKDMVAKDFNVPMKSIEIVNNNENKGDEKEVVNSNLVTNGSVKAMLHGVLGCIKSRYMIAISRTINSLAAVMGIILSTLLVINSSIMQLGIFEPIIFCFFWPLSLIIVMYIYGI